MRFVTELTYKDVYETEEYRDTIEMLCECGMGDGQEQEILVPGKESDGLRIAISGSRRFRGMGKLFALGARYVCTLMK